MIPTLPKVLFLSPPAEDYLAVTLLHGLRGILGDRVVDFPRYDVAYRSFPAEARAGVYGRGFSVFFDLPDLEVDRTGIEDRVLAGQFDLVVIADIWRQDNLFARWRTLLNPRSTLIIDGHDSPNVYPHSGRWWRGLGFLKLPRADAGFLYFKREWTEDSQFNLWHRLLPRGLRKHIGHYDGLRTTSFSFIESKIVGAAPVKRKEFPRHIVDPDIAALVPGSSTRYAFESEAEYYEDLQASRFGVTTKRSGWDCMRHYEIAANGAVPCFRQLDEKPVTCAPHGLVPGDNCLSYRDATDLLRRLSQLSAEEYSALQAGAMRWVSSKTTVRVAADLIDGWRSWADRSHSTEKGRMRSS